MRTIVFGALLAAAPSLEEAHAWLKSLDTRPESAQKQPRFAALTVEDLKTMKEIKLGGHRASDGKHVHIDAAGFRFLAALPALEKANLGEVDGFSDEALAHVASIATLTELDLGDAWISDAGLKPLSKLKNLRRLQLGWTRDVGDAGLPHLLACKSLEVLGLGGTKVTDAGLPLLAKLPKLKELGLSGTAVTDAGLERLAAAARSLTTVTIGKKSKISAAAIDRLKKARPDLTVVIN